MPQAPIPRFQLVDGQMVRMTPPSGDEPLNPDYCFEFQPRREDIPYIERFEDELADAIVRGLNSVPSWLPTTQLTPGWRDRWADDVIAMGSNDNPNT